MGTMIEDSEFHRWIEALHRHPEWREELRRLVLTTEVLELPALLRETAAIVRDLAEAQKRNEARIEELTELHKRNEARIGELAELHKRNEARIEELAELHERSEARIDRLEAAIAELAEAQRRTEERVEELAEAQRRTEERLEALAKRVDELAEAQRRTEERLEALAKRVDELAETVDKLAKAQSSTEAWLRELAEGQRKLGQAVGALQTAFGATIEEEAASVVEVVLRRKGYRVLKPAFSLPLDGEIDVVLPLEDSSGGKVWAVVEAKARLTHRDVRAWAQRMREAAWHEKLAQKGVVGPYLVYAYGIRVDAGAEEAARKGGIG
ncbi:MAG: hypothetical protein RML93_11220, partial [Anaerolineales bacterium]|nr:hypothetical protein [Anaerolineales bacterium]MDW8447846.1 hypothetical protein [Anaerolineales bacterium]